MASTLRVPAFKHAKCSLHIKRPASYQRSRPRAQPHDRSQCNVDRRLLLQSCMGMGLAIDQLAWAEGLTADLAPYKDAADQFTLQVPATWELVVPVSPADRFRAGVSSTRTLVWLSPADSSTYITVVITNPGADYTTLGSFGSAQDFGQNLVTSMDRSYELRRNGGVPNDNTMLCTLVGTSSTDKTYFVEYKIQRGVQEMKHLYSTIALGTVQRSPNAQVRRFYTVTATCPEGQSAEVGGLLAKSVKSLVVAA